jgi:hypothetical protein
MRVLRLALAGFAVLVLAAPAEARQAFDGKVCGLVSAKQIKAVPGLSLTCTNARPSKGIGSTNYVGNWAGKTASSPSLQITIALYTDSGALQLAKRNLEQGLPGTPKLVAGIGTRAYEAVGASSAGIHFSLGKYIAYVILNTRAASPRSTGSLEALAKAVAARL